MDWEIDDGLHFRDMGDGIRLMVEWSEFSEKYEYIVYDTRFRGLDGYVYFGHATTLRGGRAAATKAYNRIYPAK